MKIQSKTILLILVLVLAFVSFFFKLGQNALIEFDEGIYALVAKRMAQSGDFLILTWREGVPWFDKGPLYFWLTAPLLKTFGFTALAVRFWSALFGFLTVLAVYLIGKELAGDYLGILAATILTSTIGFVYYARLGMLDVPNAFFNTASLLFLIYSRKSRKFWYLASFSLGIGFLNRGFLSALGLAAYLAESFFFGRRNWRIRRELFLAVLIFLIVALPWHLYVTIKYGRDFLMTYFGHQMFSRFLTTIEGKGAPFFWYLTVARTHFRIWLVVFFLGFFSLLRSVLNRNRVVFLFLFWTLIVFVFFTFSRSKLIWYILPLYPPLSLLTAAGVYFYFKRLARFLPGVCWLFLLTAALYNFHSRGRILTRDFNRNLMQTISVANRLKFNPPLLSVNFGYSVPSFYSRRPVADVHISELKGLLTDSRYALIRAGDLKSLSDGSFFYREVYRQGEVVLVTAN